LKGGGKLGRGRDSDEKKGKENLPFSKKQIESRGESRCTGGGTTARKRERRNRNL